MSRVLPFSPWHCFHCGHARVSPHPVLVVSGGPVRQSCPTSVAQTGALPAAHRVGSRGFITYGVGVAIALCVWWSSGTPEMLRGAGQQHTATWRGGSLAF